MRAVADEDVRWYNALVLAHEGNFDPLRKLRGQHSSYAELWARVRGSVRVDAERAWEALQERGVSLTLAESSAFPPLLREIHEPPLGLYSRGAAFAPRSRSDFSGIGADEPRVAIVGTRKATREGLALAKRFGRELAEQGIAVVSGLALGIDGAAHAGALEANGRTIGVLACGLDRVYPREHERLAEDIIASGGTLVSEYPLGAVSFPDRFLDRNRIVSGLSLGVVVIEAPEASGSLATARFALEQNRSVCVVPGPVTHPNYAGSHELIRAGACLARHTDDVLEELGLEAVAGAARVARTEQALDNLDETEKMVITVLIAAGGAMAPDAVAAQAALEITQINQVLSMLVVKGLIREEGGKYGINV